MQTIDDEEEHLQGLRQANALFTYAERTLQLLSPIKITGKKPINFILNFLTWSLYGPKPVTADFWPIMEKLS